MSDTTTLVRALRILARDIHCEDGVATQCITDAADTIERLRLTDEEREVLATVRDIYESHGDDDSCSRIAAVIDGLLGRTH